MTYPSGCVSGKRGNVVYTPYYLLWQLGSIFLIRRMHKRLHFDYAHYLTFGSILLPTFFFLCPGKLIWGPIGGGENVPFKFWKSLSTRGRIKEIVRHAVQNLYRLNPLIPLMSKKAEVILLRNKETGRLIPNTYKNKIELFIETALPDTFGNNNPYVKKKNQGEEDCLRIITVGRYIYSKINRLTFDAIAEFKEEYGSNFRFTVVGDGIERSSLEKYSKELGLNDEVIFTGWLTHNDVFDELISSDIYFSTTFKEGGTWAFFEAIAMEIPIVCLATSGPDIIVGNGCGIKVQLSTPRQATRELVAGLCELATNDSLRDEYAKKAKKFLLQNYTWIKSEERMVDIYRKIK